LLLQFGQEAPEEAPGPPMKPEELEEMAYLMFPTE
jgi:hypothetical protein